MPQTGSHSFFSDLQSVRWQLISLLAHSEVPQRSREACPRGIGLAGLVGLYILLFSAEKLQEA